MTDAGDIPGALHRPDRRVAAALCVLPGLGQLYNGQPRKAVFFFLGTLFSLGPAVLLITYGEGFGHSLLGGHHFAAFLVVAFGSVLIFLVLFVLGLFLWASSAADAWRTARAIRSGGLEEAAQTTFFRL
jgi:TM2 domain-containing membrane protein YozV